MWFDIRINARRRWPISNYWYKYNYLLFQAFVHLTF